MTDVKVEFTIGDMKFSGEGDKEWLSQQLDKIIEKVALTTPKVSNVTATPDSKPNGDGIGTKPLAKFLDDTASKVNQVRKFLATAIWLHTKLSQNSLSTREITVALRQASQSRLGNPAECLNKNVSKGFCEKDENGFYVTDEGRKSVLGA